MRATIPSGNSTLHHCLPTLYSPWVRKPPAHPGRRNREYAPAPSGGGLGWGHVTVKSGGTTFITHHPTITLPPHQSVDAQNQRFLSARGSNTCSRAYRCQTAYPWCVVWSAAAMLLRQPCSQTGAGCSGFPARYGDWLALLLSHLSRSTGKVPGVGVPPRPQRGRVGVGGMLPPPAGAGRGGARRTSTHRNARIAW